MGKPSDGLVGELRMRSDWTVAELNGEIDFSKSRELRAALEPAMQAPGKKVIINLKNVKYMDSTGLATLVACRRQLAETSGRLRLCCLSPRVQGLIEITQLNRVFEIFPTEEEAAA